MEMLILLIIAMFVYTTIVLGLTIWSITKSDTTTSIVSPTAPIVSPSIVSPTVPSHDVEYNKVSTEVLEVHTIKGKSPIQFEDRLDLQNNSLENVLNITTTNIIAENILEQENTNPSDTSPFYDLYAVDTEPIVPLGTKYTFNNKVYRYVWIPKIPNDSLIFQSRNLVGTFQLPGFSPSWQESITIASALLDTNTFTFVATRDLTVDELKNSVVYVNVGSAGQDTLIKNNTEAKIGETVTVTIDQKISNNLTSAEAVIIKSKWIIAPYKQGNAQVPVGVVLQDFQSSSLIGYTWIQTAGLAGIRHAPESGKESDNLLTIGKAVIPAPSPTGRVMAISATTSTGDFVLPQVGICMTDATWDSIVVVDLRLE